MHIIIADAYAPYLLLGYDYLRHHLPAASITAVSSAEEALTRYRAEGADVVITSQRLPLMTGIQLIEALHAGNPKLPVIMHSADESYRDAALKAGARAFVFKRGSRSELVRTIRQVLPPRS